MKIILDLNQEELETTLNQTRNFKDDFLAWAVEGESLTDYVEENLMFYLKTFNKIDKLILCIIHKMDEEAKKE